MRHDAAAEAEAEALFDAGAGQWAPPPRLSISEWSERHRKLPETSAAKGGRWHNTTAPYLVEIMDVCRCARDDGNRDVRKVALMKAAQSGGSSAIENVIGFHIEHDPCAILVVHPIVDAAREWSHERFDDLVRSTPELATRVRDRRPPRGSKHESGSTVTHKAFPGGQLFTGGANTPNTFARRAARLVIADDFERFPVEVGEEGDPADLLVARTASYHDGLLIYVSTPALKGGRIDALYQRSDRRRYHVACPQCGREDWISWSDPEHFRVAWDEHDPTTARIECPDRDHGGCGAQLREHERREMVAAGRWLPTRVPDEPGLVGFHLPAMISTLGNVTLEWIVSSFLAAHAKGMNALKTFINTFLGEGWEERGSRIESHALLSRRESYGADIDIPAGAAVLTAGVDVQVDRFAMQVIAWGPGLERWLVDWQAIRGDPKRPETQASLLAALRGRYRHASGLQLPILATCIDSGYATDEIYAFVMAHAVERFFATKGVSGHTREPIVFRHGKTVRGDDGKVRLTPWNINVDDAKADVMDALSKQTPGPGYLHLSEVMADESYLSELTAEHRETQRNKSGVALRTVWVQDRANEALDTAVLCLAALHILAKPNPAAYVRRAADRLAAEPAPGAGGQVRDTPASAAKPPNPPRTRSWRPPA